jgi:hypothetical protein
MWFDLLVRKKKHTSTCTHYELRKRLKKIHSFSCILYFFFYLILSNPIQAFAVRPVVSLSSPTALFGCRVNAKKEKIKRNRENMRKFSTPGKRGMSRRKILKKAQASEARQKENEFITKCFITGGDSDAEAKE